MFNVIGAEGRFRLGQQHRIVLVASRSSVLNERCVRSEVVLSQWIGDQSARCE